MSSPVAPTKHPGQIATFLDLIKFAHSIFALPFALLATFWAFRQRQQPILSLQTLGLLAFILACMVLARTWAMTFNRLVDRTFDAANPRTAKRPSVTGAVSVPFMRATLAVCLLGFLTVTAIFWYATGNLWPLFLAIPILAWLASYSYTKRFTALCHFWLGISLGLAPLSAWIALHPPATPLLAPAGIATLFLAAGVAFWVAGFDILYALQDESFDRAKNLHSIPAKLGRTSALWVSRACHTASIALFTASGLTLMRLTSSAHPLYWTGFASACALLILQQSLISPTDIRRINLAFMTANGLVGLLFGTLAITDTLL